MVRKYEHAGRPHSEWTFNYEDLCRITGKKLNTVQASKRRPGGFDPDDLLSIVFWCGRNMKPEYKLQMLRLLTEIPLAVDMKPRRKKAGA